METRLITTEKELIALKEPWNRLVRENPETDMPFFSWDWFYRSWLHFGKPIDQQLFVVVVEESKGGRLLGVWPLIGEKKKSGGISYRSLNFCATGIMPRNTCYFASDVDPDSVFHALAAKLLEEKQHWDMIELANIPETSAFHRFLLQDEGKGVWTKIALIRLQGFVAPYIKLTDSIDDYYDSLGRGTRKDLRRRMKKFKDFGDARQVRFFSSNNEIQEGLELFFEVHRKSWKGEFTNPHTPRFYREIADDLSRRDEILIAVTLLSNIPISAGIIVQNQEVCYSLTNDHDMEYRGLAPGMILFVHELGQLIRDGKKVFDFCGTAYDYKDRLSNNCLNHSTFQIFHGGLKSRFLYYAKTSLLPRLRKILREPEPDDFISKSNRLSR